MTTSMTELVVLLIIILIDWVAAELRDECVIFVHPEEEAEGEEEVRETYEAYGSKELSLKDLLTHSSTNGYKLI